MTKDEKIKALEVRVEELEKRNEELVGALLVEIMRKPTVEKIEAAPTDPCYPQRQWPIVPYPYPPYEPYCYPETTSFEIPEDWIVV